MGIPYFIVANAGGGFIDLNLLAARYGTSTEQQGNSGTSRSRWIRKTIRPRHRRSLSATWKQMIPR